MIWEWVRTGLLLGIFALGVVLAQRRHRADEARREGRRQAFEEAATYHEALALSLLVDFKLSGGRDISRLADMGYAAKHAFYFRGRVAEIEGAHELRAAHEVVEDRRLRDEDAALKACGQGGAT